MRHCPICDGFEYSGKRVAVIGDGAHGVREADFLGTYSSHVILFDIVERPRRIERRSSGIAIVLADGTAIECDMVYAALGSDPKSALAAQLGAEIDGNGSVVVDKHCRTSVSGLYAAGDVVAGLHQLAVAVGQGAAVATAIHNDLRTRTAARARGTSAAAAP